MLYYYPVSKQALYGDGHDCLKGNKLKYGKCNLEESPDILIRDLILGEPQQQETSESFIHTW